MSLAVILAAGVGARAGGAKIAWPVEGTASVRRVALAALGAVNVSEVRAVTGRWEAETRDSLAGLNISFVHNPDYAKGQSSSIAAALRRPTAAKEAIFLLADQPFITSQIIDDLIQFHRANPGSITRPVRNSPAVFDLGRWREPLTGLSGDQGGRALIAAHPGEVNLLPANSHAPQCFLDFDTREDYENFEHI